LAPFWVWAPSVASATYRYSDSCPPPPGNLTHAVCSASMMVNCPGLRAVGLTAEQSTVPGGLGSLPPQAASTTEPTSIVLGKRERITCGSGPAVRQARDVEQDKEPQELLTIVPAPGSLGRCPRTTGWRRSGSALMVWCPWWPRKAVRATS